MRGGAVPTRPCCRPFLLSWSPPIFLSSPVASVVPLHAHRPRACKVLTSCDLVHRRKSLDIFRFTINVAWPHFSRWGTRIRRIMIGITAESPSSMSKMAAARPAASSTAKTQQRLPRLAAVCDGSCRNSRATMQRLGQC